VIVRCVVCESLRKTPHTTDQVLVVAGWSTCITHLMFTLDAIKDYSEPAKIYQALSNYPWG
jgi:hypothetical protein